MGMGCFEEKVVDAPSADLFFVDSGFRPYGTAPE